MEKDQPLSLWQKIIKERAFTQEVIAHLLKYCVLTTTERRLLESLLVQKYRDGFPRKIMTPFVLKLKESYGDKIPRYFWKKQNNTPLSQNQLLSKTQTALQKLNLSNWSVQYNSKKTVFSVNISTHTITVPKKNLTSAELQSVLAHELLVHVLRWSKPSHVFTKYKLFEEGLASSIQFYLLGNETITYGRNKVRDVFLFLWELGFSVTLLEKYWKCITPIAPVSRYNYTWMPEFLQKLKNQSISKQTLRKYKRYALGVRRFEKFLKRFNSKNQIISDIARQLTLCMLDYKFDALNPTHLLYLNHINAITAQPGDLVLFCQKDSHAL